MRWNYYKLRQLSFFAKCDGQLLQIATAFSLQCATRFITSCDRYYKVRWIYYKLRQVLQSAMIITNCDSTPPLSLFGSRSFFAPKPGQMETLATQAKLLSESVF